MPEIIRSVAIKNERPFVKFDRIVTEGSTVSSVFPGSGSKPVLPSVTFEDAISDVVSAIATVYELPTSWEWQIDYVSFLWNDECGEYGFKAVLAAFDTELGTQKITIAQKSPSHLSTIIVANMAKLERETLLFIRGASAQGSFFDSELKEAA